MHQEGQSTRQSILRFGKAEFLDKGFRAASLRNIAGAAGVTTGAFYGYFDSKEALFRALVDEPAQTLLNRYQAAHDRFAVLPREEQAGQMSEISWECMNWMVEYLYRYFDAFKLIFCRSEGTEYERYLDVMVEIETEATHRFMEAQRELGVPIRTVDRQLEHILISGMFSALFEVVVHDLPQCRALDYVRELQSFYSAGWRQIMGL